jgi:HSP20 family protein
MVLQRWDPFRDLRQMDETMNRLWRGYSGLPSFREGAEDWNILVDVIQNPDQIIVKASLPGIDPDAIDVAVEDNILTLRADRKSEIEEGAVYLLQERPTGSFYRAIRLPDTIDTNKIECSYENGVLTMTMPKSEEKKKRRIKVSVSGGQKAIAASKKQG